MKNTGYVASAFLLLCGAAGAQSGSQSGIDLKAIDKSVNPCGDFYQYACGNWRKANPIPPEYSRWGRFPELQNRNQQILRGILEDSTKHQDRSPVIRKLALSTVRAWTKRRLTRPGINRLCPVSSGFAA